MRTAVAVLLAGVLATGCAAARDPGVELSANLAESSTPSHVPDGSSSDGAVSTAPANPNATRLSNLRPEDFDQRRAMGVVRHLAVDIGPRHATSPAFREAATWVSGRFETLGYRVTRERFEVPGGDSWGVPVAAGRSMNVVATPIDFDPQKPYLIVGAHLDTVPPAPGAEDNASGVGVLLAAADAVVSARTRLPVVWVAFGAEEPRGPTDDDHHFGSRAYVGALTRVERRNLRAMVSLDRVGVGAAVPVGSAGDGDPVQRRLLGAGRRTGVPTVAVPLSRSSDHWSFVRAGLPGARLGSTSYDAYHSATDLPDVVDPEQLGRTGRLLLAWLAPSL